jgi:hypothetical protein
MANHYPIHRVKQALDGWKQQHEGLCILESHLEQDAAVPEDQQFGGWMGYEWQPRLAELPDNVIKDIESYIIPAIKGCSTHPDAPKMLRNVGRTTIAEVRGIIELCQNTRKTIEKVFTTNPTRRTQYDSIVGARHLLQGLIMPLGDFISVSENTK